MPDPLGYDPSIFGSVGPLLSDELSLFLGDPLADLLPSFHEGLGDSTLAFEINKNGLRTRETGLEAWIEWNEQQRERQQSLGTSIDPITGLIPTVSVPPGVSIPPGISSTTSTPTLTAAPIRIEAESMTLSDEYQIHNKSFASGKQLISLNLPQQKGASVSGSAESVFTGESGTYAVVVGYHDQSQATGQMSFEAGNDHIAWSLDQDSDSYRVRESNLMRRVISSRLTLNHGDVLRLGGSLDRLERAAIDYVELIPVDSAVALPFRVEAEDMTLEGYDALYGRKFASGDGIVKLNDPSVQEGTSRFAFPKQYGYYDVVVGYYDHKDGTSEYSLQLGDKSYEWLGDKSSGPNWGSGSLTRQTVAEGVLIDQDEIIEITGLKDKKDSARIDYIEFIPSAPTNLNVIRDASTISILKNAGTQLWSVEGRGGGTTTYEFAIGSNGAQADLHQQAEHVWQNGVEVPWNLEVTENQVIFSVMGESMSYPIEQIGSLNGLSLLTKVNSSNGAKVSDGTTMALAVTAANGATLGDPIYLSSEGTDGGQDLDELFIGSAGKISTLSGTAQLSWPDDGVNPHITNSQSRVTFKLSGYHSNDLTVIRDPATIGMIKNAGTRLWGVEGRGGGTTTYEFAIGSNGAQANLHQQAEHVWENGVEVPWNLEWQGNQVIFTIMGETMSYPIEEIGSLDGLSLLTKVNSSNGTKVSAGTTMILSVTTANEAALGTPVHLSSEGPDGAQDLDELFIGSTRGIGTLSGTVQLSWPDDGVNPHTTNSQSHVTFNISGYRSSVLPPASV